LQKFVDEITIRVKAGNGGPGSVSFRREKYIPKGGPDGGDGGRGGDVYIQADPRIINLSHLQKDRLYKAKDGKNGQGQNKHGKDGENLLIKVPIGTILYDSNQNPVHDFTDETPFLCAEGARGGKGNAFFKTSTMQAPRHAQPGETTEELEIELSLKLIADVGLVGFPNAGKSTLLKALTKAHPRIGNYPFTTLSPNLGTLDIDSIKRCIIADIPGIIEGASQGHGLGISFLKHIERVKLLIFVLDVSTSDVEEELRILRSELATYNPVLNKRPYLIVFNKCDLIEAEFLEEWIISFKKAGYEPIPISAQEQTNLDSIIKAISKSIS